MLRSMTLMLSSPRNPPSNRLFPSSSLRLTHQVKLSSSLWNTRARNRRSRLAGAAQLDLVDRRVADDVDGRIDVAEGPLVGGNLPVRMHVPLAQHKQELVLGEPGVDQAEADAVEGQVPGGVPGILPLVRHRDDIALLRCGHCCCGRACVPQAAAGRPDRHRAIPRHRSCRTACSRSARPTPVAALAASSAGHPAVIARRRTRRLRLCGQRRRRRSRSKRLGRAGLSDSRSRIDCVSPARSRVGSAPPPSCRAPG